MSVRTANNEAVVIREIEEVWNSDGDLDVIDDLVAKDVVYHSPMMDMEGRDEYREAAKEARTIFTDLEMSVEDVVPTDEKVAVRYIVRGTHSGEMMGIEPTDERIEMTGILIDRIEDGKIQERYDNADELGMFVQLGVVELPEMEEFEQ
ncbi:ester cyclase [Haladaptatus sp. DFWS20]|uniref:ester cyclase n=1 Tax=Haladaptatus sp. DFWS20 TaxID=3403467 RepID=UPI003EB714A4